MCQGARIGGRSLQQLHSAHGFERGSRDQMTRRNFHIDGIDSLNRLRTRSLPRPIVSRGDVVLVDVLLQRAGGQANLRVCNIFGNAL